uniref:Uncharacterized protein n=1 Tax=Ditylenchus dipsaci TaxID=166011 RepID=A0A915DKA2_9BILA
MSLQLAVLLCVTAAWNLASAGTWLSFNQMGGGGIDQEPFRPYPLPPVAVAATSANSPAALQSPLGNNILNLFELCSMKENQKRRTRGSNALKARSQEFMDDVCQKLFQVVEKR